MATTPKAPDPTAEPHGDSGGSRTPAGSDYGDYRPAHHHEGERESLTDDVKQTGTPPPGGAAPASDKSSVGR